MKRILFIGAGASFGARITSTSKPPLGNQLCSWLRSVCPLLMKENHLIELQSTIEEGFSILQRNQANSDYEKLVSTLERNDRVALQRLIQICFSDLAEKRTDLDLGFKNFPDGFDLLIDVLKLNDGTWSVISLNYDILFEEALRRNGIKFLYPRFPFALNEDQTKLPGVRIYKPHGSINFFAHAHHIIYRHEPLPGDDRGMPTGFHVDESGDTSPTYPIMFAGMAGVENVLGRANAATINQPVMANYAPLKKSDANQETLLEVRKEAIERCLNVSEMVIIGVRPIQNRTDDPFVSELLAISIPKYTYVSVDESECAIIRTLHKHAITYTGGLHKFLCKT